MATVVLTIKGTCTGGGHVVIGVTVNGVDRGDRNVYIPDVTDVALTDAEIVTVVVGLVKLHKIGKTNVQVRNNLLAGLSLTV